MLRMSDLSGGSVFPGFEEYLTGYPLASLDLYVFAKTWYAAEMPRPGCVWTHSLLVNNNDMQSIPSLEALGKFFIRPVHLKAANKTPKIVGQYSSPLQFTPDNSEGFAEASQVADNIRGLVTALYEFKQSNLLIPAPSAQSFENAILRLWSQQWPQLRHSFSFCTGALSSRGFAGKPFDVQCSPPQLIREITTSAFAKQSVEMSLISSEKTQIEQRWVDEVAFDAGLSRGGKFRSLLWSLADGNSLGDFKSFANLTLRLLSDTPISLSELVTEVSIRFPEKSSGDFLKNNLFGENRSKDLPIHYSELDILTELATSDSYAAFDPKSLKLQARASVLCQHSPDEAKQLITAIFKGPVNSLGEEILTGLLESINPEIAKRITAQQPHFLPALFHAKPELGRSAELWQAAGDHARELFEALASKDSLSDELITASTEAFLSGGSESLVRRALDKWGKPAVFGVLNYVAQTSEGLSERAIGALTFHDKTVMEWLVAGPERPLFAKLLCAHVVAPYSYKVKEFGTDVWLRTYEELRQQSKYNEVNYLASFLLALGLQNASPIPIKVIGLCFQHIHQLAWDDKMPDANWIILEPIVPHLLWIHDWDKCERLRRGLVEAFVKFHWPREQLATCIKNDDLLSRVLKSAKWVDGGYEHFRNGK